MTAVNSSASPEDIRLRWLSIPHTPGLLRCADKLRFGKTTRRLPWPGMPGHPPRTPATLMRIT